jgi:hypothetical protein
MHHLSAIRASATPFRCFRTGGFTAGGNADLSDADLNAIGAKTGATLDIYRQGNHGTAASTAHELARPAIKPATFVN